MFCPKEYLPGKREGRPPSLGCSFCCRHPEKYVGLIKPLREEKIFIIHEDITQPFLHVCYVASPTERFITLCS